MATVFIVMLVVVQIGFLVLARSNVAATIDATLRQAATTPEDIDRHRSVLAERMERGVPSVTVEHVTMELDGDRIDASVTLHWTPPGPDLTPVSFTVERERTIVVPP